RQNNDDDTGVFLSIGDDAAVVSSRGRKQVLTGPIGEPSVKLVFQFHGCGNSGIEPINVLILLVRCDHRSSRFDSFDFTKCGKGKKKTARFSATWRFSL
ncbi:MAG: hypothetical protein AAF623_17445, partial [Planctomycetota bacterium]